MHKIDQLSAIEHSLDWFLGDKLQIAQPKQGFRAGFDSVMLGASVAGLAASQHITAPKLVDLGCGVGVAGLVASCLSKDAHLKGVEKNLVHRPFFEVNQAQLNFTIPAEFIGLDVGAPAAERVAQGLEPDWADIVFANPPYYPQDAARAPKNESKASAHLLGEEGLEPFISAALSASYAKAWIMFILPSAALAEILALMVPKLGDITILPLQSRASQPSHRVLVRGRKGTKGALKLLSSMPVHQGTGRDYVPKIDAVVRGKTAFEW